jgi:hypothetical protein
MVDIKLIELPQLQMLDGKWPCPYGVKATSATDWSLTFSSTERAKGLYAPDRSTIARWMSRDEDRPHVT